VIFIDSGAFVARFRKSDDCYDDAQSGWARLEKSNRRCFTSNLVIAESVDLIAGYNGVGIATQFVRALLASDVVILRSSTDDDIDAAQLMQKYADQQIGYADCVSFSLMKRNKLRAVFAFDRRFQIAGFSIWPGKIKD
jgi:predicted nucleic acid-binding protein